VRFTTVPLEFLNLIVKPDACPSLADSLIKSISVEIGPAGINYPIVNAVLNKPTSLRARTFGIGYSWQPTIDLSNPNIANPVLIATGERLYRILITNKAGCVTIDTQKVNIFKDRDIYVPKAFSPNNDGQNDRLYPIPVGIKEMIQFKVFNRRGVLVYDNKNANASTGWDGTFRGKKLPVDTYVWVAQGIDEDGKTIRRTGNVVLVR
jgi:gliding motility-associated-like protein